MSAANESNLFRHYPVPLFFSAARLRMENVNLTLHLFIALCQ